MSDKLLDLRYCDLSNKDLQGITLSGALMVEVCREQKEGLMYVPLHSCMHIY